MNTVLLTVLNRQGTCREPEGCSTTGHGSVLPCTFPKRGKRSAQYTPRETWSSAVGVRQGGWHSSLISSTCSIHSLSHSKQEVQGLKNSYATCSHAQAHNYLSRGRGLSVFFTISTDTGAQSQGRYLKRNRRTTAVTKLNRPSIGSTSQTEARNAKP